MAALNKAQAVYEFWSGFTWPAYDEGTVPDDAVLPYITFESGTSGFDEAPLVLTASLWSRSTSWAAVEEKSAEIAAALGMGGSLIGYPSGALWVKRGNPWGQRLMEPDDDSLRRIVLHIKAEFLS